MIRTIFRKVSETNQKKLSIICLSSFLICTFLFFVYCYWVHFYWFYVTQKLNVHKCKALPVALITNKTLPSAWVQCQEFGVKFSLPLELATNKLVLGETNGPVVFTSTESSVIFDPPRKISEFKLGMIRSLLLKMTLPEMEKLALETSVDDFRWSMSKTEVACLIKLMLLREIINENEVIKGEWLDFQKFKGLITYRDGAIQLRWQYEDNEMVGCIEVRYSEAITNAPALIYGICNSLKVIEVTEPESRGSIGDVGQLRQDKSIERE